MVANRTNRKNVSDSTIPPAPILLVDDDPVLSAAVARHLSAKHLLIMLARSDDARRYLVDSTGAGRRPSLMIARVRSAQDERLTLVEWVRSHSIEDLSRLAVVVVNDYPNARTPIMPGVTTVAKLESLLRLLNTDYWHTRSRS